MRRFVFLFLALLASACATGPARSSMNEAAIVGKRWVAEASGLEAEQRPRLEFQVGGRVAGYTGCNSVSGSWRIEAGELRLGALATTKRACLGPGGDFEKRFLAAVNERSRLTLEGARLVAHGAGGERLPFIEAGV